VAPRHRLGRRRGDGDDVIGRLEKDRVRLEKDRVRLEKDRVRMNEDGCQTNKDR
jgi:hypothetical protein